MRNSMIPTGEIMSNDILEKAEKVKDTAQLIQECVDRMFKIMDEGDKRVEEILEGMK